MGSYIEEQELQIEKKYSTFFQETNTRLEQYIIYGKKSEKHAPVELELVINKKLPEEIKKEVENLYKPFLSQQ